MLVKRKKPKTLDISGEQLLAVMKKAAETATEEIEEKRYLVGPEILFEYEGKEYTAGIKYDKKAAKKETGTLFSEKYMSYYLDKDSYETLAEWYEIGKIGDIHINSIEFGIVMYSEYEEIKKKM